MGSLIRLAYVVPSSEVEEMLYKNGLPQIWDPFLLSTSFKAAAMLVSRACASLLLLTSQILLAHCSPVEITNKTSYVVFVPVFKSRSLPVKFTRSSQCAGQP